MLTVKAEAWKFRLFRCNWVQSLLIGLKVYYVMSGLHRRHHHRGNVHPEIKGWILLHSLHREHSVRETKCWIMKLLQLSVPLSLPCKVWCNTKVHLKQHMHKKAANRASSCLSAWNRDSVNVANLSVRHDTKSHIGIQTDSDTSIPLPFSFFPLFIDIRGLESL